MVFCNYNTFVWYWKVQKLAKRWRCSTEALLSLNQRNRERYDYLCFSSKNKTLIVRESVSEILIITDRVLSGLLATVRRFLPALHDAAEGVTSLDMLMAFAMRAVSNKRYGFAPFYYYYFSNDLQRISKISSTVVCSWFGANCIETGSTSCIWTHLIRRIRSGTLLFVCLFCFLFIFCKINIEWCIFDWWV